MVARFRPERRLAALAQRTGLAEAEIHARIWEAGIEARGERGELTLEQARDEIGAALGRAFNGAALGALWALAFEPDPQVLAIADAVRARLPAGLLTNNGPVLLDILPAALPDVARRFDPLLFSCRLQALKPSPEIFQAALEMTGRSAGEVLLIDDSTENVAAARAAGLLACHYRDPGALRRELAARAVLH